MTKRNPDAKRRLIATFSFNVESANTQAYIPVCSWYWDFSNPEKPIQLAVKYAWSDFSVNFACDSRLFSKQSSLVQQAQFEITDRISNWEEEGHFDDFNFYDELLITEFGKALFTVNGSKERMLRWIENGDI